MKAAPLLLANGVAAVALSVSATAAAAATPDVARAGEARLPEVPTEYLRHEDAGLTVAYHPATRERVRTVLPMLGPIRDELRAALGAPVLEEVQIRVAALDAELDRLSPAVGHAAPPEGRSVVDRNLVIVSATTPSTIELERALRHHLAHLALSEASGGAALPPWFEEGFATHFAGEGHLERMRTLGLATVLGDRPRLDAIGGDARSAVFGADFVRFARSDGAGEVLPSLVAGIRDGLPFRRALETAFGRDAAAIELAWSDDGWRRYGLLPGALLALFVAVALLVLRRARARRRAADDGERAPRDVRSRRPSRLRLRARTSREPRFVPPTRRGRDVPRIEHDGRWHTLH